MNYKQKTKEIRVAMDDLISLYPNTIFIKRKYTLGVSVEEAIEGMRKFQKALISRYKKG